MNFGDPEERDALAGEYVLGVLSPEDTLVFERELARNNELARAVYYWQDRLLDASTIATPAEPAADLWRRIERDLPQTNDARTAARAPRPGLLASLGFWRALTALGAVASVVLAWMVVQGITPQPGPRYAAVLQAPDKSAGWLVETDARRNVRLVPLVRTSVGPQQALEFWTKPEGAAGPTSLGLVPADRITVVPASRLPALGPDQLFEITLEPATGSPIGRPTGPVLFIGRAVAIQ